MKTPDPMSLTVEELFQRFLEMFATDAIEAYQYFDAEHGNTGEDASRDAAVASVLDEGYLGPDMFALTGVTIIRTERDRLRTTLEQLVTAVQAERAATPKTTAMEWAAIHTGLDAALKNAREALGPAQ